MEENSTLTITLHLRIEAFFVFAKIAMDQVTCVIEDFFGADHEKGWKKHERDYATRRGLQIPDGMIESKERLRDTVGEYRNRGITHHENPRLMRGTLTGPDGESQIAGRWIHPKDDDPQTSSPKIAKCMQDLDEYVLMLIDLIEANRDKARYSASPDVES